jgi:hypothetical protein
MFQGLSPLTTPIYKSHELPKMPQIIDHSANSLTKFLKWSINEYDKEDGLRFKAKIWYYDAHKERGLFPEQPLYRLLISKPNFRRRLFFWQ